jgi:tRNA pseudouridine38-40 synthase
MAHWKLTLAYDGTAFHGWQVQPSLATIQGTLAATLHHITGETVLPQGSGRTDAGVHALAQVATVTLNVPIPAANLIRALNRALPPAIRVLAADVVPESFHARHSAIRKTYEYRIFPRVPPNRESPDAICPPFLAPYVWDCPWPIDLTLANRAAAHILGEHNFASFAASDPDQSERAAGAPCLDSETWDRRPTHPRSSIRRIDSSQWTCEDGLLIYRVTGSGFLHHMVRNLVGTFVDVATCRLEPNAIPRILAKKDRSVAGQTAPARGLFLVSVEYPEQPIHSPAGEP